MTVGERQEQLVPKEDLTPYAGHWVALRNGYVIASALDAVTLREQREIRPDDVLIPVRRHGAAVNVYAVAARQACRVRATPSSLSGRA